MLLDELKKRLKGKIVILGIGNTLKGDDGFGPELIKRLKGKVEADLIDGGTTPENYLKPIINLRPEVVMIVDAVHFGGQPGEIRLLEKEDILSIGISTHNFSPKLFMDFLSQGEVGDIFMLAVQPSSLEFGGDLGEVVLRTLGEVEELLIEVLR